MDLQSYFTSSFSLLKIILENEYESITDEKLIQILEQVEWDRIAFLMRETIQTDDKFKKSYTNTYKYKPSPTEEELKEFFLQEQLHCLHCIQLIFQKPFLIDSIQSILSFTKTMESFFISLYKSLNMVQLHLCEQLSKTLYLIYMFDKQIASQTKHLSTLINFFNENNFGNNALDFVLTSKKTKSLYSSLHNYLLLIIWHCMVLQQDHNEEEQYKSLNDLICKPVKLYQTPLYSIFFISWQYFYQHSIPHHYIDSAMQYILQQKQPSQWQHFLIQCIMTIIIENDFCSISWNSVLQVMETMQWNSTQFEKEINTMEQKLYPLFHFLFPTQLYLIPFLCLFYKPQLYSHYLQDSYLLLLVENNNTTTIPNALIQHCQRVQNKTNTFVVYSKNRIEFLQDWIHYLLLQEKQQQQLDIVMDAYLSLCWIDSSLCREWIWKHGSSKESIHKKCIPFLVTHSTTIQEDYFQMVLEQSHPSGNYTIPIYFLKHVPVNAITLFTLFTNLEYWKFESMKQKNELAMLCLHLLFKSKDWIEKCANDPSFVHQLFALPNSLEYIHLLLSPTNNNKSYYYIHDYFYSTPLFVKQLFYNLCKEEEEEEQQQQLYSIQILIIACQSCHSLINYLGEEASILITHLLTKLNSFSFLDSQIQVYLYEFIWISIQNMKHQVGLLNQFLQANNNLLLQHCYKVLSHAKDMMEQQRDNYPFATKYIKYCLFIAYHLEQQVQLLQPLYHQVLLPNVLLHKELMECVALLLPLFPQSNLFITLCDAILTRQELSFKKEIVELILNQLSITTKEEYNKCIQVLHVTIHEQNTVEYQCQFLVSQCLVEYIVTQQQSSTINSIQELYELIPLHSQHELICHQLLVCIQYLHSQQQQQQQIYDSCLIPLLVQTNHSLLYSIACYTRFSKQVLDHIVSSLPNLIDGMLQVLIYYCSNNTSSMEEREYLCTNCIEHVLPCFDKRNGNVLFLEFTCALLFCCRELKNHLLWDTLLQQIQQIILYSQNRIEMILVQGWNSANRNELQELEYYSTWYKFTKLSKMNYLHCAMQSKLLQYYSMDHLQLDKENDLFLYWNQHCYFVLKNQSTTTNTTTVVNNSTIPVEHGTMTRMEMETSSQIYIQVLNSCQFLLEGIDCSKYQLEDLNLLLLFIQVILDNFEFITERWDQMITYCKNKQLCNKINQQTFEIVYRIMIIVMEAIRIYVQLWNEMKTQEKVTMIQLYKTSLQELIEKSCRNYLEPFKKKSHSQFNMEEWIQELNQVRVALE